MPYDDLLPLHAPLHRPWLHPLRRRAVRASIREICRYLEIAGPDEVFDEERWLTRPEWSDGSALGGDRSGGMDSWSMWHMRRAGVELAAWRWSTQLPDARRARYDHPLRQVTFRTEAAQPLHRDGGPALIGRTVLEWYDHGTLHREDGPARIDASDGIRWLRNGTLHRDGGPAQVDFRAGVGYFREGRPHRVDGPALFGGDTRSRQWWRDGERHRDGGPALISGTCCPEPGVCRQWWVDGRLHRVDGPAEIHADGSQLWHRHGMLHRVDGPAVLRPGQIAQWWRDGAPLRAVDEHPLVAPSAIAEELFL